jgi:vancomycin resistance protein YoaR
VDFRFRNNRNYPIMLRVHLGRKSLTVDILENRSNDMVTGSET